MEDNDDILGKKLSDMTGDEFLRLLQSSSRRYGDWLHGVSELSEYLHMSKPTIYKLIHSGALDQAMRKVGNVKHFNRRKVDEIITPRTNAQ